MVEVQTSKSMNKYSESKIIYTREQRVIYRLTFCQTRKPLLGHPVEGNLLNEVKQFNEENQNIRLMQLKTK